MANHPIPIDALAKGITPKPKDFCIPWGDTITLPFSIEADLVYIQPPPFPPAFLPPIPTGHFYPGDVIGPRTAQPVIATVKMGYTDTATGVSNTITIHVKQNCP
jgi:hypothetical protein